MFLAAYQKTVGSPEYKIMRFQSKETHYFVFLTMSTEHALNAYEVDAIQYLVKPLDQNKLFVFE